MNNNERLELAKDWYNDQSTTNKEKLLLEKLFPELKESDDEKIRKDLIDTIHLAYDCGVSLNKEQHDKAIAWLKKQGERKPVDKVEPKFKIGDWIVFNNDHDSIYQIEKIENYEYTLRHILGGSMALSFSHRNMIRAWTIQDAKDGDVLCDYHEAYDNPLIFILKKFEHVNFGLVRPSDYSSYCFLTASDKQMFKEGTYHHEHNIKPATKEQRDLLFQKMNEAGYEWDDEKKELRKIEQKPTNKIEPKFKVGDIITSTYNNTLKYLIKEVGVKNELGKLDYVAQDISDLETKGNIRNMSISKVDSWGILIEQKPTWSDEDEKNDAIHT